jgi:hypothetical protein
MITGPTTTIFDPKPDWKRCPHCQIEVNFNFKARDGCAYCGGSGLTPVVVCAECGDRIYPFDLGVVSKKHPNEFVHYRCGTENEKEETNRMLEKMVLTPDKIGIEL